MNHPKTLVTGATGKTGGAVARLLLAQGWPVRALVRRQDPRSESLARLGAEVVVGDLFDVDALCEALQGVQRAYYVLPLAPYMAQAALAFAAAARQSRLELVVQLSQWLSHRHHPAISTRETWLVDELFAMLPGVAHITVNPGMFADNFLRVIDFATLLHLYPVLMGDSKSAPVSNEDIARVAVAALMRPERHLGQRLRPTGPALLDGREMAAAIAGVLGHRVTPVDLPTWLFRRAARLSGASRHEVYSLVAYMQDHRAGAFSWQGGVTDVVLRLTGTPAESFATTAARYAALPFARATLANRLSSVLRFAITPLTVGFDLAAYEREMGFPQPTRPSQSLDDARWVSEHQAQMGAVRTAACAPLAPARPELAPAR